MRRLFVLVVLLWPCPQVWAQCPTNGIAVNPTNYVLLMPSDVPGVTATITGQAELSGAFPSHSLTLTPGIYVQLNYTSNHGVSGTGYWTLDNDPTHRNVQNYGLNGGGTAWYTQTSDIGHVEHLLYAVTDSNGNVTTDRVNLTVVAGSSPSIVGQDELSTNLYQQATASFSGTSSMACGACQQNPQACSNVTHEGRISFELDNLTSGESQVQPMIYGPLVNPTFNNGLTSNPLYLSVLPGDTTQDSQADQVECSLYGLFYNQSPTDPGGYTYKVMKTKIHIDQQGSTTAGVTRWYVSSRCKDTQHVPIWEPEYIDTKGAATILLSEGQYAISMQNCKAKPGMPAWDCPPIAVTPPQPLTIGVGGTSYDCSTLINTPLPQ